MTHNYLQTASRTMQSRLRKRGRLGKFSYIHTIRKQVGGQIIEVKTPINHREYSHLLDQQDSGHFTVNKTRRCFMYNNQYFQLDIYKEPCHPRCKGLMLLETYTTLSHQEFNERLPKFLNVDQQVTGDPAFSMFNLSLREEWINNKRFCHRLSDDEVFRAHWMIIICTLHYPRLARMTTSRPPRKLLTDWRPSTGNPPSWS